MQCLGQYSIAFSLQCLQDYLHQKRKCTNFEIILDNSKQALMQYSGVYSVQGISDTRPFLSGILPDIKFGIWPAHMFGLLDS